MRCDEVRPVLPELAEGTLREAGPAELHVASCVSYGSELRQFRAVVLELGAMKEALAEPPEGFLERILTGLPEASRPRLMHRVATDERFHVAALSLGGAVVGATAIGLLWWRAARRTVATAAGSNGERLAPAD
jgi:hypothetical protein